MFDINYYFSVFTTKNPCVIDTKIQITTKRLQLLCYYTIKAWKGILMLLSHYFETLIKRSLDAVVKCKINVAE